MTGTNGNIQTTLSGVSLDVLQQVLREQNDVRFDAVVPASALSYVDGNLHIAGAAMRFTENGIDEAPAMLVPTEVFEGGVSTMLGIPRQYLRKMRESGQRVTGTTTTYDLLVGREDHPFDVALLDANVNGWLQSDPHRRFLVRAFRTDDPDAYGIARALLSNKFALGMDNFDVLLAALAGARSAGIDTSTLKIVGNLTERNMRVLIEAPEITALAPLGLRERYRDPRTGRLGRDYPLVSAGLAIGNSETGGGAMSVAPRFVFQVCTNGMTRTEDLVRAVHTGARLEDGVIRWSAETHQANVELIKAKTRDAVAAFLDTAYMERVLGEMAGQYDTPVTNAAATIERIAKVHAFTDDEAADILDCFIKGGDLTAGGVMQAVTASAQNLADPDRAAEYEDSALAVLATAAKAN